MDDPPELPLGDITGIAICLVFSAFFSGTETALTALSLSRTQQVIDEGGRWARALSAWLEHPNRTLTTLLVGNNLVNILGSILAGRVAHVYLDSYADAAAVAAMTMTVLVLGEVTPKTFAKHNPGRVAVPAMHLVRLFMVLFYPLALALTRFSAALVRLFGGRVSSSGPSVTEGEIEYMIELGAREGVFQEEGRGDLLQSALEFDETIAKEVMIPRTEAHFLQVDVSLDEALQLVTEWGHSRIPVYGANRDQVVGILYAKDLLHVTCTTPGPHREPLDKYLRTRMLLVPETQRISETLRQMRRQRMHLGIVLDEFGGTAGLITIEDIIEELVGEIRDEYDDDEADLLRAIGEGEYEVNALMSIFDLGDELGVEFPDNGEYESVGGYLTHELGRVPGVGDEVTFDAYRFRVTAADERHVEWVHLERFDPTVDPDGEPDPEE